MPVSQINRSMTRQEQHIMIMLMQIKYYGHKHYMMNIALGSNHGNHNEKTE